MVLQSINCCQLVFQAGIVIHHLETMQEILMFLHYTRSLFLAPDAVSAAFSGSHHPTDLPCTNNRIACGLLT